MRKLFPFLVLSILGLALVGCKPPPVNRNNAIELKTVPYVDLTRYAGLWYEIARFENSFEENCTGVTATYTPKPDGTVTVLNTCRKNRLDGQLDTAKGSARIVDTTTNAKLAVSFFGPFEGDYWVIGLAPDYSWALVGEPSGRYLWVLARSPALPSALKGDLIKRLDAFGYNTAALTWTLQPQSAP